MKPRVESKRGRGTIGRKERFPDARHDPYQPREKPTENSVCPTCGARFVGGRWAWSDAGPFAASSELVCPACRRIAEKVPAGIVELAGDYLPNHRVEIDHLIRNEAAAELAEHPMEKIMAIESGDDGIRVSTTGLHVARRIGNAVASAHGGELNVDFGDGEYSIRVRWERNLTQGEVRK